MSKSPGWYASKVGARLPGGPDLDWMICCELTRQWPRPSGFDWNHRSISVPGEIPTHTLCRSICRRPVTSRLCLRLTSTEILSPVEHGAPLRLIAPVKLGPKNIKAITRIAYTKD